MLACHCSQLSLTGANDPRRIWPARRTRGRELTAPTTTEENQRPTMAPPA
jgi:hypothetical protein